MSLVVSVDSRKYMHKVAVEDNNDSSDSSEIDERPCKKATVG